MNSPNRRKSTIALALTAGVFFAAPLAWAQTPVPVVNAGFEDPVLGDGVVGVPADWAAVAGGGDLYNPTVAEFAGEAPEGSNVISIYAGADGAGFSQILAGATGQLQAGATYALTVQVGDAANAAFDGYKVQLLANGTVLAEDDNSAPPADGTWATATVNYVYNAADVALVGEALEIRLLSKGLLSGDVEFDDVQLTVTLGNPVANPGGPYKVSVGDSLSLDGSSSLPSDGETITLYEWDLDSDGSYDDASGVTPAAITDADLQATYGMSIGANTIALRVTEGGGGTVTATGTVTLAAPIVGQLGVLDLDNANGGINPATGLAWAAGDTYRLIFLTSQPTDAVSPDISTYNSFVQGLADVSTTYPDLGNGTWRIVASTEAVSAKVNTGTDSGTGEAVFLIDGTTKVADDYADLWDGGIDAVVSLDENASAISEDRVFTGSETNGTSRPLGGSDNPLGNPGGLEVQTGRNDNPGGNWMKDWKVAASASNSVYAMSYSLTVVDLTDSTDPNFVSIVDDRSGADIYLGVGSIVYTVSFDEGMSLGTVKPDDFELSGTSTATATIDYVAGTSDPSIFEVTVTPTSVGTVQLQIAASSVLEDFAGNAVDTNAAITDDTVITVANDPSPPTPDAMTWAVVPAAASFNSITMTATTAMDTSGVEYYFEETTGNPGASDSGWQDSPTYIDGGLDPLTTYSYQVKARDKSASNNETGYSSLESADTTAPPTTPFIYEPFDDLDPSLNGNTPGLGLTTGTWNAQAAIANTSLSFGNLATSGGHATAASSNYQKNWIEPGTTLIDAGLMADGATLWFSALAVNITAPTENSTARTYIAIGNGTADGFDRIGSHDEGKGFAIKLIHGGAYATGWKGPGGVSASGSATIADGTHLVVGKITWGKFGETDDTLELFLPGTDLVMPGSPVSTATHDFDQLGATSGADAFDTISFAGGHLANAVPEVDEIRFGASYDTVVIEAAMGYDVWVDGPFLSTLTDTDPALDFDGGGLETGIEWVVGGDPTDPSDDAGLAPTIDTTTTPGSSLFVFRRTDEAEADANTAIKVEYGSDLLGWTEAQDTVAGVVITVDDDFYGAGIDKVTVSLPDGLAADGMLYARLNVVVTTP